MISPLPLLSAIKIKNKEKIWATQYNSTSLVVRNYNVLSGILKYKVYCGASCVIVT
jgi:hypothetical protein